MAILSVAGREDCSESSVAAPLDDVVINYGFCTRYSRTSSVVSGLAGCCFSWPHCFLPTSVEEKLLVTNVQNSRVFLSYFTVLLRTKCTVPEDGRTILNLDQIQKSESLSRRKLWG